MVTNVVYIWRKTRDISKCLHPHDVCFCIYSRLDTWSDYKTRRLEEKLASSLTSCLPMKRRSICVIWNWVWWMWTWHISHEGTHQLFLRGLGSLTQRVYTLIGHYIVNSLVIFSEISDLKITCQFYRPDSLFGWSIQQENIHICFFRYLYIIIIYDPSLSFQTVLEKSSREMTATCQIMIENMKSVPCQNRHQKSGTYRERPTNNTKSSRKIGRRTGVGKRELGFDLLLKEKSSLQEKLCL